MPKSTLGASRQITPGQPKFPMNPSNNPIAENFSRSFLRITIFILAAVWGANAQTIKPQTSRQPKDAKEAESVAVKTASAISQRFEREGIAVDFSIAAAPDGEGKVSALTAGTNAVATFRVIDVRTGQPITGLHPNAWITSRRTTHSPNEIECKDKIGKLMGGLLSVRADIDLNSYLALTLNHDNTITIINPQVSFSTTKLESIIPLPGPGVDWVATSSKDRLYVTLPNQSVVAVVNTATRKLLGTIPTGEGTKPTRIALQPDGRRVWVTLDNSSLVAVIDTATDKLLATVPVGAGLHNIAFTSDNRFAYVTNSLANSVSAIDIRSLTKVAEIVVGKTPLPISYSDSSRLIYVAAINGESISVVEPVKQQVVATVPVGRGVVALKFAPEGRFAFAVNQVESKVSVIDSSTNSLTGSLAVVKEPDQINFTKSYAYVRGIGSEKFSLIDLREAATGKLAPVNIQAGRQAPSVLPDEIGVADMIAPTPEGNAVMIANAPDQMLYYYVEGMMAPMGTINNYKRRPRALMVLDRSLSEVAPGVYSSQIKLSKAGNFDVPLLISQPRLHNCFQLAVNESTDPNHTRSDALIKVQPLFDLEKIKPGAETTLKFKIVDSVTKQPVTGLRDVLVLAFEPPGIWQARQWADEIGEGVYVVKQIFPSEGLYNVMVGVASRGVSVGDFGFIPISVSADAARQITK